MKKSNKKRDPKLLIYVLLIVVVFLVSGYAILSQTIALSGTASADADFSILWENPVVSSSNRVSMDVPTLSSGNTVLNFNPVLQQPGSSVTVTVNVKNNGNLPAVITNITTTDPVVSDIIVTYSPSFSIDQTLAPGASIPVDITVQYNPAVTETQAISENFGIVVEYSQEV